MAPSSRRMLQRFQSRDTVSRVVARLPLRELRSDLRPLYVRANTISYILTAGGGVLPFSFSEEGSRKLCVLRYGGPPAPGCGVDDPGARRSLSSSNITSHPFL